LLEARLGQAFFSTIIIHEIATTDKKSKTADTIGWFTRDSIERKNGLYRLESPP
jgi:hypothetical protein